MNRLPFAESKSPWRGVLDLATGCYPPFLFGGGLGRWLPVFHFHEARPAALQPYFAYLADNGYRTVTSEALAALVRRGVHPGPRSVALCFDDAWASLWIVVAPLLRRYGLQAITYVSPAHVSAAAAPRPQWEAGSSAPAPDLDRSETSFATWPELRALHASGAVDIQAHSWRHATVFYGDAPLDFVRPGYKPHPHLYPWSDAPDGARFVTADDLGAPLYPVRSRMSDALRFCHPAAFEACVRHVRGNGGAAFFERPGWRADLHACVRAAGEGRFETAAERDAAIREDLGRAREILNSELRTDAVRHMCFPFAVAGASAARSAQEAGYETAFADRLFGARSVRAGDDPFRLMRLKHQYLFCLPGRGRRWFFSAKPRSASAPDGEASHGNR
jgi:hypothetical protein